MLVEGWHENVAYVCSKADYLIDEKPRQISSPIIKAMERLLKLIQKVNLDSYEARYSFLAS